MAADAEANRKTKISLTLTRKDASIDEIREKYRKYRVKKNSDSAPSHHGASKDRISLSLSRNDVSSTEVRNKYDKYIQKNDDDISSAVLAMNILSEVKSVIPSLVEDINALIYFEELVQNIRNFSVLMEHPESFLNQSTFNQEEITKSNLHTVNISSVTVEQVSGYEQFALPTNIGFLVVGFFLATLCNLTLGYMITIYRKNVQRKIDSLENEVIGLMSLHKYTQAIELLESALIYIRQHHGRDHIDFWGFKHLMAKAQIALGQFSYAESLLKDVLSGYQPFGDDEHTGRVLEDLAYVNYKLGRTKKSTSAMNRANRINDSITEEEMISELKPLMKTIQRRENFLKTFKNEYKQNISASFLSMNPSAMNHDDDDDDDDDDDTLYRHHQMNHEDESDSDAISDIEINSHNHMDYSQENPLHNMKKMISNESKTPLKLSASEYSLRSHPSQNKLVTIFSNPPVTPNLLSNSRRNSLTKFENQLSSSFYSTPDVMESVRNEEKMDDSFEEMKSEFYQQKKNPIRCGHSLPPTPLETKSFSFSLMNQKNDMVTEYVNPMRKKTNTGQFHHHNDHQYQETTSRTKPHAMARCDTAKINTFDIYPDDNISPKDIENAKFHLKMGNVAFSNKRYEDCYSHYYKAYDIFSAMEGADSKMAILVHEKLLDTIRLMKQESMENISSTMNDSYSSHGHRSSVSESDNDDTIVYASN
jgi:tetratricopeptide (TPR) repeat protein